MKRKIIALILASLLSVGLVGCGGNKETSNNSETSTKTEDNSKEKTVNAEWTHFNDAKWNDDFNGLKSEVVKVVVSDKTPKPSGETDLAAVGVKFKMTNTTKEKFTAYPDQAVLVTSTGEEIKTPDESVTASIGGVIEGGATKEGNVIWYLKNKGTAKDITWIKLTWKVHQGGDDAKADAPKKEYEVKISLK